MLVQQMMHEGSIPNGSPHLPAERSATTTSSIIDDVTYPTNSLNFLKHLGAATERTPMKLDIVIVGAGLGGLSAAVALSRKGHTVHVLEQASQLGEVGAGIQIPSNSARLLYDWGLEPFLENKTVEPHDITFRRWQDGKIIGLTNLVPNFRDKYKAPYLVVHRAHFHQALYDHAINLGVKVHTNSRVVTWDESFPSVTLANGQTWAADLIIAADGIKSSARQHVPDKIDHGPQATGFAAYRATVDVEMMRDDSEVSWLLDVPALNIWIGDGRHVMTYTIASGNSFNMVLSHRDYTDPSTWTCETALEDMRKEFASWDPSLVKVIHMIKKTIKWPLMTGRPRTNYLSASRKIVLLGDAAHAMLPYMSQGAAMAVEDAAAICTALSSVHDAADIMPALEVYERVRANRASQMQEASLVNGMIWHFPDGPEQQARDKSMENEVLGRPFTESANQWSDPLTQDWAYGYDVVKVMNVEMRKIGLCS